MTTDWERRKQEREEELNALLDAEVAREKKLKGYTLTKEELRSLELTLKRALRKCKRELKTATPDHDQCCPVLEDISQAARREAKHDN